MDLVEVSGFPSGDEIEDVERVAAADGLHEQL